MYEEQRLRMMPSYNEPRRRKIQPTTNSWNMDSHSQDTLRRIEDNDATLTGLVLFPVAGDGRLTQKMVATTLNLAHPSGKIHI